MKMKIYEFKKGDKVPQFVEIYDEKIYTGKFTTDVKVIVCESMTDVYPLQGTVDSFGVMKFESVNSGIGGVIKGLPTQIHQYPYGDVRNNLKINI